MVTHRHTARLIGTGSLLVLLFILAGCTLSAPTQPTAVATDVPTPMPVPPEAQISAATAGDVRELARLEGRQLHFLKWMPDGSEIVAVGWGAIGIYDSATLSLRRSWNAPEWVTTIAIAPDGRLIAGVQDDHVLVWSSADGSVLAELEAPDIEGALAFAPDGRRLLGAGGDLLWEWSPQSWEVIRTTRLRGRGDASDLAISADGALLVVSFRGCEAQVFNANQIAALNTLGTWCRGFYDTNKISLSADGTLLAMNNAWREKSLWNTSDGSQSQMLESEQADMGDIAFAPAGPLLATVRGNLVVGEVLLWDSAAGVVSATLTAQAWSPGGIDFSPQGDRLAGISHPNKLVVWNLADPTVPLMREVGEFDSASYLVLSADGRRVAAMTDRSSFWQRDDDQLLIWDEAAATHTIYDLDGHTGSVTLDSAAMPPVETSLNRRRWITEAGSTLQAELDPVEKLWNWNVWFDQEPANRLQVRATGSRLDLWPDGTDRFMLNAGDEIKGWAITPDEQFVAISLATPGVAIWSIAERREVKRLPDPPAAISKLGFSPEGDLLLGQTEEYPAQLVLWNVETSTLLRISDGKEVSMLGLFSNDQSLIIVQKLRWSGWYYHNMIELRRTSDEAVLKTLIGQPATFGEIRLSPDGTRLVASRFDGTLMIWGLGP